MSEDRRQKETAYRVIPRSPRLSADSPPRILCEYARLPVLVRVHWMGWKRRAMVSGSHAQYHESGGDFDTLSANSIHTGNYSLS